MRCAMGVARTGVAGTVCDEVAAVARTVAVAVVVVAVVVAGTSCDCSAVTRGAITCNANSTGICSSCNALTAPLHRQRSLNHIHTHTRARARARTPTYSATRHHLRQQAQRTQRHASRHHCAQHQRHRRNAQHRVQGHLRMCVESRRHINNIAQNHLPNVMLGSARNTCRLLSNVTMTLMADTGAAARACDVASTLAACRVEIAPRRTSFNTCTGASPSASECVCEA
jgi:hypothetical protein